MAHWKRLDMRRRDTMPAIGALVALRLTPTNGRATFYREERYEIGRFKTDEGSRKAWWVTTSASGRDPVKLRKHYDIWWCPVHEFDGAD